MGSAAPISVGADLQSWMSFRLLPASSRGPTAGGPVSNRLARSCLSAWPAQGL